MSCTQTDFFEFFTIFDKHCCNKYRFCHRSFRWSGRLERFTRFTGETVQIQAVIPVSSSDQRKFVRSEMCCCIMERFVQMFKQRYFRTFLTVKWYRLIKNAIITGFFQIGGNRCNQPQRIIIKSASDIEIALLCQWLILMICASVRELCRCNINNSFPCAFRNQMYKSEKILTGITESHASSGAGFIIRCRS